MSRKDKETIVFVVNVGSLNESGSNKETVKNAKQLMKNIIEKKIFLEPKDEVGIILTGVDVGVNALQFDNIEDYHPIQVCNWNMVEKVLDITATDIFYTNWIAGLHAGVNLIQREAEDAKRRTIVVIMDCPDTEINQQAMKDIAATILEEEITLLWVGTSSMLELGREQRNNSEKMVQRLCRRVNGKHATFSEVLSNTQFYGGKQPKPSGWRCNLEISDIKIPTITYLFIAENKPLPAWKTVAKNPESENLNEVINVKVNKGLADYQKKEYDIDNIVRGYKYGRKFIPMADDFTASLKKLDTEKSLIVYGFLPKEKVKLRDRSGNETHMLLPSDGAEMHFFSLLKAMADLNVVAIVRRVYVNKCDPKMKILYPQIDDPDKPWCFLMVDHMFIENLGVVESRTYEEIYKQLKDDEWDAVDNFIDQMMLKDQPAEDEDKRTFEPGTIPNPDIQHTWNQLAHRSLNPLTEEDPPAYPPADYIMDLITPPKYLQNDSVDKSIDRLVQLFKLDEKPVVKTISAVADKSVSINEKSNDTGYSTQAPSQNNDPPSQMDVDLDALFD
ncbi:hypothetical protein PV325_006214 [Microctonus aethiopoides]|uniref:Ku domain-containing protein n=1 Tax=Microctonus aethiopoides TaxID=144406 RepID=A0AA39KXC3_9HYME|nr:hypothetical protein PV325_006214 [Microctonus aethiopoides]KAK0079986.1 hypothetical protein PV326_008432 [Microctonus aethiopoides]KAK0177234.1 hypothetical protein PV328_001310 [Microctonus aethiopoides]